MSDAARGHAGCDELTPAACELPPAVCAAHDTSVGGASMASRVVRSRATELAAAVDRRAPRRPQSAPRMLVQVFDGGSIPTAADKVFLTHPVELDCDDAEGATPTFTADPDQTIPVIVVQNPATAGDWLVAHAIGGRWVAEIGGSPTPTPCPCFCPGVPVNFPNAGQGEGPITLSFTPNPNWEGFSPGGGAVPPFTPSNYGPYTLAGHGCSWSLACPPPAPGNAATYGSAGGGNAGVGNLIEFRLSSTTGNQILIDWHLWAPADTCGHKTTQTQFIYGNPAVTGLPNTGQVPLALQGSAQDPFHMHFKPAGSPIQPNCDGQFPFSDLYLDAPASGFIAPYFCVTICVACGTPFFGAYPDTTITLTNASGFRQTLNTGSGSCATFNIHRKGTFTITVDSPGYSTFTATQLINSCNLLILLAPPGHICCGGTITPPSPALAIPENLTLTGAGGTTPFILGALEGFPGWYGQTVMSETCTRNTQFCGGGGGRNPQEYCQIGEGEVVINYYGLCTDNLPGYPPGLFLVRAFWSVVAYAPVINWACAGDPAGWFEICQSLPGFPCPDSAQCAYVGRDDFSGGGPAGNCSAELALVPSSTSPFAWNGALVSVGCSFPTATGAVECPIPGLGVAITE